MTQVKYIGTVETKVRIAGVKTEILPDEVFEMDSKEAKELLNGFAYRHLFIEDGAELSPKQSKASDTTEPTDEFDAMTVPSMKAYLKEQHIDFPRDAKRDDLLHIIRAENKPLVLDGAESTKIADTIAEVVKAESIDALNIIATDIANDEELSENEEVNKAVEDKMALFLSDSGESANNASDSSVVSQDESTQAPEETDETQAKKKAV